MHSADREAREQALPTSPSRCEVEAEEIVFELDFTVPGDVEHIAPAVARILEIARRAGCVPEKESELEVALHEGLANAIVHGCKEDPEKEVRISAGCDRERGMIVVIRDPGDGFDPAQIPSPLVGERLYATHGRGIFLIDRLMDEVRFGEGGSEIWMRIGHGPSYPPKGEPSK